MWKQTLCLGTNVQFGIDEQQQIRLFHEAGFNAFFTGWNPEAPIEQNASLATEIGMIYQSLHAPFNKTDAMWGDDSDKGEEALIELLDCLRCCDRNGIPLMISHAFIGFFDHSPTQAGIDRERRVLHTSFYRGFGEQVQFADRAIACAAGLCEIHRR